MATETVIGEPNDQFPIGMRVLAVDDDPTSLFLLETMLRLCHYNVTTTRQAMAALKLLRENKNMFDLVISDVHMPDMDGFKLLEFVGLEMDLPVIMMSVDGDTKLVMKGITHGACDYLVKPVRMEELRNIWQHVVRRKKQFDRKDRDDSGCQEKLRIDSDEAARMGDGVDQKRKLNKKRKDQEEEEEDDQGRVENLQNYQNPISTQKKPRVIWSRELHCNFVAAVNQLGIDKAVPKKILELMNEKNLTRENVASHLQKFRLFLKRLSADQQASLAAASLGNADSSYLKMGSHLNVLVNFHNLARSNQCHNNAAFTSFPRSNVHGRLRASAELGMHGLPSAAGMTQSGRAQNWGTTSNVQSKQQSFVIPGNYEANNTQQGILPMPLEVDEPQSGKIVPHISQLSTTDFSTFFPVSGSLIDARMTASTDNPLLGVTSSSLILEGSSSNQVSQPGLQSQEWNGPYHSNAVSCSMNSFPNSAADGPMVQLGQCLDRNSSNFQRSMDLDETGPPNFVAPFP